MELYETESQQVEAIKAFFKRNGKLFIFGLALFLVIVGGMRYWQHHGRVKSAQASDLFQMMLIADLGKDTAAMEAKANDLIKNYSSTPYAKFAAFMLAKEAVIKADLPAAEQQFRWAIKESKSNGPVYHIATERLARILMQRSDYDAALKLLGTKEPEKAYISLYEETKGDIYLAQDKVAEAKIAYLKAAQELPAGAQAPVLQLKLLDLGVGVENA